MSDDERAIRELVETWMSATAAGDMDKVLSLISEDAIFMVPGREPFGKDAFAAAARKQTGFSVEGTSDIREIKVLGDWAYLRNHLTVTMSSKNGGRPSRRSGYTLTILRKEPSGDWVLVRDANLLAPEA